MPTRKGFLQGYNAQVAVTCRSSGPAIALGRALARGPALGVIFRHCVTVTDWAKQPRRRLRP
jgi:hypothetical protein